MSPSTKTWPGGTISYFGLPRPWKLGSPEAEYPPIGKYIESARKTPDAWIDLTRPFWWDLPMLVANGLVDSVQVAHGQICRNTLLGTEEGGKAGGGFATRNSCREKSVQALDLRVAVGLPLTLRSGGTVFLTLDAFNLVSSETGIVDRAAFLIDPAGSLGTGGNGSVTVPLVANPRFGTLLSRRVEPRLLRLGLKMEY